jgi:hypothetical protein
MKCHLLAAIVMISCAIAEEARPIFLPFDVMLGDQKATMKTGNEVFAVVEKPVKPNVMLTLEKNTPMLIINAFACKEDGSVEQGTPAAVIFAQNTANTPLDATLDKKPLAPGAYLMNVVAGQETARIVFTIEDPAAKVKMPSLDAILGFLRKKAG